MSLPEYCTYNKIYPYNRPLCKTEFSLSRKMSTVLFKIHSKMIRDPSFKTELSPTGNKHITYYVKISKKNCIANNSVENK